MKFALVSLLVLGARMITVPASDCPECPESSSHATARATITLRATATMMTGAKETKKAGTPAPAAPAPTPAPPPRRDAKLPLPAYLFM